MKDFRIRDTLVTIVLDVSLSAPDCDSRPEREEGAAAIWITCQNIILILFPVGAMDGSTWLRSGFSATATIEVVPFLESEATMREPSTNSLLVGLLTVIA